MFAFIVFTLVQALNLTTVAAAQQLQLQAAPFDPAAAGFKLFWANTTIDHFGFAENGMFPLRVYVNDQHWDSKTGPILFCE